ncbi:MAG: acyl-CoA thioesterase [Eubacterium sp.]|nr:acyl-CoA thioesterase [Eubacterium sp.]
MSDYKHVVSYYETDKMGVTHHSNYIRWMEEARVDFMKQHGWPYERFEEEGIISPVIGLEATYINSTTFPDEVSITVSVKEFKTVKLTLHYVMKCRGEVVFEGDTRHCFLYTDGKPVRLKREYPGFYDTIVNLLGKEE